MHKKFQLKSYSVVSYTYVKLLEKIQLTSQVLYGNPILYLSFELSLNIVLYAFAKSPKLLITSKNNIQECQFGLKQHATQNGFKQRTTHSQFLARKIPDTLHSRMEYGAAVHSSNQWEKLVLASTQDHS